MISPARHRAALNTSGAVAPAPQGQPQGSQLAPKTGAAIDHIIKTFVTHAAPVIHQDTEMQKNVGAAAGAAAADRLSGPVTLAAGAVTIAAGVAIWKMLA